ncbi:unnamed protein product, partial [Symbiodinium sp. KB8]
ANWYCHCIRTSPTCHSANCYQTLILSSSCSLYSQSASMLKQFFSCMTPSP